MTTDANDAATTMQGGGQRWRIAGWTLAALLLLLPAVAMQLDDEVNWTAADFVFAGVLIGGVGLALEGVVRRSGQLAYRLGAALFLLAAFLLVWIDAAVGIIGGEDNPLNLLYPGVVAVGVIGGAIARFRPRGLVRAMLATALAQAAMTVVAIVAGGAEPPGVAGLLVLHGVFVTFFLGAAWLFAVAARSDRIA
jgi:hypothetical protein